MLAKDLNYPQATSGSFTDISGHWATPYIKEVATQKIMTGYANGSFKPEQVMSRVDMVVMLARTLHVISPEEKFSDTWPASFHDVKANDWGFHYIELANKLKLLPPGYLSNFHPSQLVSRAEAVWMLNALNGITVSKGKINHVDVDSGLVNVQVQNSSTPLLAMVSPETILLRNNSTSTVDALLVGDDITVIALPSGEVKYVKSFGKLTKNDLLSRISSMTQGKLKPEQISEIASGDWSPLQDDAKGGIYNELVAKGLTPAEAESIMVRDWGYLDTLSRDRLAQALSAQLGITQEFSQALLTKDLPKIKEYGKIELATAALTRLLGSPAGQNNTSNTSY